MSKLTFKSALFVPLCVLLFACCFAASCDSKKKETVEEPPVEDIVPIEEVPDAPQDQVEALTDTVALDSTDSKINFNHEGAYIYVSKAKMRLYVVDKNDSVVFSCGIACGIRKGDKQEKGDYRTPEGHFRISGMFESTDWIHRTRDGRDVKGCYGPYFLRLATGRFAGIGIHGTNAPGSIGKRASEGCIRVKTPNIILLRKHYAYDGMPVIVSGERERLPKFKGLGAEALTEEDVLAQEKKDSVTAAAAASAPDSAAVVPHEVPGQPEASDITHSSHTGDSMNTTSEVDKTGEPYDPSAE